MKYLLIGGGIVVVSAVLAASFGKLIETSRKIAAYKFNTEQIKAVANFYQWISLSVLAISLTPVVMKDGHIALELDVLHGDSVVGIIIGLIFLLLQIYTLREA